MTRGPIVHQLCVGRNREKTNTLDDRFHGFPPTATFSCVLWFTTLAKYSRHAWHLLGVVVMDLDCQHVKFKCVKLHFQSTFPELTTKSDWSYHICEKFNYFIIFLSVLIS